MAVVRVLISRGSRHYDWEEDDSLDLRQEDWRKSSTLWPEDCLNNPTKHPERPKVFLRLDEESLALGYENDFLSQLIDEVGPHMWGAEIYVLLHQEMALISPIASEDIPRPNPQKMFDLFLEKGVSDVLHWPERASHLLGEAATRSAERMAQISIPDPGRPWRCFVHKPPNLGPQQTAFLNPFLIRSINDLNDENCLVVLQANRDPDQSMKFLERLSPFPGDVMIGVIDRLGQLPPEVIEFCRRNNYELIGFHGLVELYYFLRRLDRASETKPELRDVTFSVRVKQPTRFRSYRPKLLVTHSFSPSTEEDCVAAARDTWEVTKELRGAAEIIIYPGVQVIQLADVMDNLQDVFAWVHIGHGREDGLRQSGDELYKSARDWLAAFTSFGRESTLSLAVFSSCKSAPVAKLFAAAGTGVAIGFRANPAQDKCIPLTKRVVRAALIWGGSKDKILEAFVAGHDLIRAYEPVAYWSRC
jgi:hypothetical protein